LAVSYLPFAVLVPDGHFLFFLGKKRKQKTQVKTNAAARSGPHQVLLIGWCNPTESDTNGKRPDKQA